MNDEADPAVPTGGSTRKSRGRKAMAAAVLAVVLVGGAGGAVMLVKDHQAVQRAEAHAAKKAAERKAKAAAAAAALEQARAVHQRCVGQLTPFIEALTVVDARLNVGLNQADLSNLVGKASVAYSGIDIGTLGTGACLNAGAKLEQSFNLYAATVQTWNDCLADWNCSMDSIQPGLQAKWLKASAKLARGKTILATLDPDGSTYVAEAADAL